MTTAERALLVAVARFCVWLVYSKHRHAYPLELDTMVSLITQVEQQR
jgi:hypothetical protein